MENMKQTVIELILWHRLLIQIKIRIQIATYWLQYEQIKIEILIKLMRFMKIANFQYDFTTMC